MSFSLRGPWNVCLVACLVLAASRSSAADCVGDCNGDHHVRADEVVLCVDIGLGGRPTEDCPSLDEDENHEGSIAEVVGAVASLLHGCPGTATPTDTATPTGTATPTPSPTPTATVNLPPVLPSPPIYRTYPDFAVEVPLFVEDPNGDAVTCSSDSLPDGAVINQQGVLSWTPLSDQLGPFHVPYGCTDDAVPAASTDGELVFKVQPRDSCVIPTCDPPSGCVDSLPPLDQACCTEEPAVRVAEPVADCPAGLVVFSGRNQRGFGRLQNCDKLRLLVQTQSGAQVRFNVETRCLNTNNRVNIRARMETSSPDHPLAFDFEANLFLDRGKDGFDRFFSLGSGIDGQGPFFDLDEAEANLTVWARDSDGVEISNTTRIILTRDALPDLPEPDATPIAEE